ncbi:hypothetical protein IC582_024241 [Cucumis melo]
MCAVAATTTTMTPIFSSPKIASLLCKSSSLNSSTSSSSPRSLSTPMNLHVSASSSPSPSSVSHVDTVLKRKRPARIHVPHSMPSIGFGLLETPEVMEEEGEGYSVYCKRGRRRISAMEDRFSVSVGIQGDSRQAFFGVFDGHGGAKVAEIAAKRLSENVIDQVWRRTESEVEEAIKDGYLMTDREVSEEGGGACCVTALIRNGNLAVSNVGDCRAVLSRNGRAEALTSDHRAGREDERNRIEKSGGYVDCCGGGWRVQGTLAVSRAMGDEHLKQWVISEPESRVMKIEDDCRFLILASDGLWDKVTNQEAVDMVEAVCGVEIKKNRPINPKLIMSACKQLVTLSTSRGSLDDTTVMIIQLN